MLYDPERSWMPQASCRWEDPELFFAIGGWPDRSPSSATQARWDRAKETCFRCPALELCQRDTLGEEFGVWGGLDEHQRYLIRKKFSEKRRWESWPEELRLEWGKELVRLRRHGLDAMEIRQRTGLLRPAIDALVAEWEAAKAAPKPVPAQPEAKKLPPVPFPEGNGQRHAWVRNGRRITDGWYAGHTSDGVWVRMQIHASNRSAYKFFRAENVHFYNPQRHYTVPYFGRPDAADSKEDAHAA